MGDGKAPRYVPIVSGAFWVFFSIMLLFWHPEGFLYYIRNFLGACMLLFGINSFKIGFFESDKKILLRVSGLSDKEIQQQSLEESKMKRIYSNNGQNIVTKVKNLVDGKIYLVSTAKNPRGGWQLAVFLSFWGLSNPFKPLRVEMSGIPKIFEEAEKNHFKTEVLVMNKPLKEWQNWPL